MDAVSRVIKSEKTCFAAVADLKRLDLTGEAIVLRGPWKALFDPTVLDQARTRLIQPQRPDLAKS